MSRGDLPWALFGRPIKPLSLAQMLALFVIGWVYIYDSGTELGESTVIADITGAVALGTCLMMLLGWLKSSQRMAEISLVIAAGVWVSRAAIVLMTDYLADPVAFWLSLCWGLAAGGAFLLESMDEEVDGIWTRPSPKQSPP